MDKSDLIDLISEHVVVSDGKKKLSCAKAFKINEQHQVPLKTIGAVCNEISVKIMNCQLGCFK